MILLQYILQKLSSPSEFCETLPLNKYMHQKSEGSKIRAACVHMFGFPLGWRTPLDRPLLLPLRGYGSTGRWWAEPRSPTPGSKCPSPPSSSAKVTLYRCFSKVTISLFSKELSALTEAQVDDVTVHVGVFFFYNKDDGKCCHIWYIVLEGLLADIFGIFFLLC